MKAIVSVEVPPVRVSVNLTGSSDVGSGDIRPSMLPPMLGPWLTWIWLMSSNAKIAFEPSKPLAPLNGSAETSRTPLPMRVAVRSRSALFTPPICLSAPGAKDLSAATFISVVCSTVPLPSAFSLMSVVLLMQAVSATVETMARRTRSERIGVPTDRVPHHTYTGA